MQVNRHLYSTSLAPLTTVLSISGSEKKQERENTEISLYDMRDDGQVTGFVEVRSNSDRADSFRSYGPSNVASRKTTLDRIYCQLHPATHQGAFPLTEFDRRDFFFFLSAFVVVLLHPRKCRH